MAGFVEVNGVKLIEKNDKVVSCHKNGGFEPKTMELWKNIIDAGNHVIDAGAYTGVYAIAAKLAGAGEVYAFEPNAKVYQRMLDNCKLNGVRITSHPVALWHRFEILKFRAAENLSSAGNITRSSPKATARVIGVPLDIFNIPYCDVIKVDVERAEPMVIKGAFETITRCRPQIITEVLTQEALAPLLELLCPLKYEYQRIEKDMVHWTPLY